VFGESVGVRTPVLQTPCRIRNVLLSCEKRTRVIRGRLTN